MKILFAGGKTGWAEYVLNGTRKERRNKELIKIIDGDPFFTKKIYKKLNYKNNYTKIVLSCKGKVENEKIEQIYKDFKALYFKNYDKNEYDISAVIHQDTDNTHVHVCVPNFNMQTAKQQTQYLHKIDMKRANNIRDYLILKYNLNDEIKNEKITIDNLQTEKFLEPKMFKKVKNLSRKRSSNNMQLHISNLIQQTQKKGILENKEQIINYINNNTLVSVVSIGDGYITLKDEQNNKLKVFNEIFYNNYNFTQQKEIKKEATGLKGLLFNSKKEKLEQLKELIKKDADKQLKYIHKTTKKGVKNGTNEYNRESGGATRERHNNRAKTIIKTAKQYYNNITTTAKPTTTKLQQLNRRATTNITTIKNTINEADSLTLLAIKTSNINKKLEEQIKKDGIIKSNNFAKNKILQFEEQQTPKNRDLDFKKIVENTSLRTKKSDIKKYEEAQKIKKELEEAQDKKIITITTPTKGDFKKKKKKQKNKNYEMGL